MIEPTQIRDFLTFISSSLPCSQTIRVRNWIAGWGVGKGRARRKKNARTHRPYPPCSLWHISFFVGTWSDLHFRKIILATLWRNDRETIEKTQRPDAGLFHLSAGGIRMTWTRVTKWKCWEVIEFRIHFEAGKDLMPVRKREESSLTTTFLTWAILWVNESITEWMNELGVIKEFSSNQVRFIFQKPHSSEV